MNLQHGIARLNLATAKLDALHRFYEQTLELPVEKDGNDAIVVAAGGTRIRFQAVPQSHGDAPFYHFAFNIPENNLEGARRWQKERTPLIQRDGGEVFDFSRWNAHAVYFRDPAGNILEHIARHDLDNAAEGDFTSADMLYASEIGLVVDDVPKAVAAVKASLKMEVYRDESERFASVGDEHALLIVVQRDRPWAPENTQPAGCFPMEAVIRGSDAGSLKDDECHSRVIVELAAASA